MGREPGMVLMGVVGVVIIGVPGALPLGTPGVLGIPGVPLMFSGVGQGAGPGEATGVVLRVLAGEATGAVLRVLPGVVTGVVPGVVTGVTLGALVPGVDVTGAVVLPLPAGMAIEVPGVGRFMLGLPARFSGAVVPPGLVIGLVEVPAFGTVLFIWEFFTV